MIRELVRRGLSLSLLCFALLLPAIISALAPSAIAQAPSLPEGLCDEPKATWRPTLQPQATVVVSSAGRVQLWRSGSPVDIPTAGREPIIVALEQLQNHAGEWVGFFGRQGSVRLGAKIGAKDAARASGFQGISVVGLDEDPTSSDWSVLEGIQLAQYVGTQRDIAVLATTIDSWTNRPCTTAAHPNPDYGNFYLERIRYLAIPNDLKGRTAKGDATTTWAFRLEGEVRLHAIDVSLQDGVTIGDGLGGTSEHGFYVNGLQGNSELIRCWIHGAQISAFYFVTRYGDRISLPSGGWIERYAFGNLLIDQCTAHDCGVNGSFALNVCGGVQDVAVRSYHWRTNLDGYDLSGQIPGGKWAGGAIQIYLDHKAYELDYSVPINSNSLPIALGYSLETGTTLPMSAGIQALVDSGTLPWDGFGGARSLTIVGGVFETQNLTPQMVNLRNVGKVTVIEREPGVRRFRTSGGFPFFFGRSGLASACGTMGPGLVPAKAGSGWTQQALFVSDRPASQWIAGVKMSPAAAQLSAVELDSWSSQ